MSEQAENYWVNSGAKQPILMRPNRAETQAMAKPYPSLSLAEYTDVLCNNPHGLWKGADMGKVGFKFIRDMLVGIQKSRSVNLTDIARGLGEGINLHATHKRLSRNLDNPELAALLAERVLLLGAGKSTEETRLIVHVHELNKKYARKVEYLPEPGQSSEASFKVCEVLANQPGSEHYAPVLATIWSDQVPGFISDAEEIRKVLRRVMKATENKGMVYFDDRSISTELMNEVLEGCEFNYVALMADADCEVIYRGEPAHLQELVESVETRYGKTMFKLVPKGILSKSATDLDLFVHAGALSVKMPSNQRSLSLIALKTKNRMTGENTAPLLTTQSYLRSRKALMGLVESFLSMQDVVTAHTEFRDSFDPSGFRVLNYNRLQLLMTLLQAVLQYETIVSHGNPITDQLFTRKPHDGELRRTYLFPKNP